MTRSKDEEEAAATFAERYGRKATEATRELERLVIGGDFGANGYTTVAQADVLAERLELGPRKRLLDVGAGRGWPGLYLAQKTGCNVLVTDLPLEGMRAAARRAKREQIAHLTRAVVASARRLPFSDAAFDAIVHTDVLC
jgi:2-polyprenyl-3-methyl-5-hydroxy-6-metoxy-1,4-benzoquinol methylase